MKNLFIEEPVTGSLTVAAQNQSYRATTVRESVNPL